MFLCGCSDITVYTRDSSSKDWFKQERHFPRGSVSLLSRLPACWSLSHVNVSFTMPVVIWSHQFHSHTDWFSDRSMLLLAVCWIHQQPHSASQVVFKCMTVGELHAGSWHPLSPVLEVQLHCQVHLISRDSSFLGHNTIDWLRVSLISPQLDIP